MELVQNNPSSGAALVSIQDPIAPLVNPIGPGPTTETVSAGAAAALAENAAVQSKSVLGIFDDPQGKNVLFMVVLGFVAWKYGRRFFK